MAGVQTTTQQRQNWAPACQTKGTVFHDAYRARDAIFGRHGYTTTRSYTGCYSCRNITGGSGYSLHAYGPGAAFTHWDGKVVSSTALAEDVNAAQNPYGSRLVTDRPQAMQLEIDAIRTKSGAKVWGWGGYYRNNKDCFTGDTDLITVDGPVPIRDLVGREAVFLSTREDPTTGGNTESEWVKAPVESYGWDNTFEVRLRRRGGRTAIRTTGGHRWPIRGRYGVRWATTADLTAGMKVPALLYPQIDPVPLDNYDVARGVAWGDGSIYNRHSNPRCSVRLYGPKVVLERFFDGIGLGWWKDIKTRPGREGLRFPVELKSLPEAWAQMAEIAGFFAGWFACDGHVVSDVSPSLSSSDQQAVSWMVAVAPRLGLTITSVGCQQTGRSGFGSTKANYTIMFESVPSWLLVRDDHRAVIRVRINRYADWTVEAIEPTGMVEEVFCPTVKGRNVVAVGTPTVPVLSGQSMHDEIVCTPRDLATGIDWNTVAGHNQPQPQPQPVPVSSTSEYDMDTVDLSNAAMSKYPKGYAEGRHVDNLQGLLVACWGLWSDLDKHLAGILSGPYNLPDRKAGPATKGALEAFQGHTGLRVDGICGPNTWRKLIEF